MSKKAAAGAPSSRGASRLRDLEDDVFDVAHNNLLRTATELPVTGRRQMVNSADWTATGGPVADKDKASGGAGASTTLVCTNDGEADNPHRAQVQSAVQATWEKANQLQEQ